MGVADSATQHLGPLVNLTGRRDGLHALIPPGLADLSFWLFEVRIGPVLSRRHDTVESPIVVIANDVDLDPIGNFQCLLRAAVSAPP